MFGVVRTVKRKIANGFKNQKERKSDERDAQNG